MNVRDVRDRVAGCRVVDRLRTPDDVGRLRNVRLQWLFVHADSVAITLPEDGCAPARVS